ncbi:MAG TPA: 3-hydroxyacyl-CoA dehydrogenase NAD-binding domain-containing protein, partial [Afifellaceae bacterium]|nr:3-hydroxyacyl-CoA dehydrogenase NAD-binding domain-containing protein [Afifellaceae bacterium]
VEWLLLDTPGRSANLIGEAMLDELNGILEVLEKDSPRGLVIRSAKPSGFVVGADIASFRTMTTPADVERELSRGHAVLDRLEALRVPTIAVIHGNCLGGGLELALACRHRIAVANAKLGFPEVRLGVHPGLGGTFRSLKRMDPVEAMTLMLTGRTVNARKAKRDGLVDVVTEERHVANAVAAAVAGSIEAAGGGLKQTALSTRPARAIAARRMRARTAERVRQEHYPAPFALIDLWEEHGGDLAAMKQAEIDSFARLLTTDTSRNLVRVFFLRDKMKRLAGRSSPVRSVHVIGAGTMGGDIAAWCARQGMRATVTDVDVKMIGKAVRRAARMLERELDKDGPAIRDALDRLVPDPNGYGAASADLVIEAAPERLELKQRLYADIEPRMKEGAVLATNTSSLPLEELRQALQRPERFVGIHFFNPVARMQLVEVVSHDAASGETLALANGFVGAIDRLPTPVRSAPGFLVNRVLTPYLLEAMLMIGEGRRPELVDEAAERFGMPMGPAELADRVGLDIAMGVGEELKARIDRPMPGTPDWLKKKLDAGQLGVKTGKGIYDYDDKGKPKKGKVEEEPDQATIDRLILPMLDACTAVLREGVVEDEELVDGAMIFGTGFAPFRGGPLNYARTRGIDDVVAALERLAGVYGERFRPDEGWARLKGDR